MCVLVQFCTKEFATNLEDTVLKFKFNLCMKTTESWMRIVNGIDKFVRETMPIQEEEKASGKPAAKSETNIKTVINKWLGLYSYGTEKMD